MIAYIFKFSLFIILLVAFFTPTETYAQATTKIRGKIIDADTKEPLSFVSIIFKGTSIGTITDDNGAFFIETKKPTDSIVVSYIGYITTTRKIRKNIYQEITINLKTDNIQLNEVVITPGENPAFRILRKINENKENNNPNKLKSYQYEVYNKVEVDVNNIDESYKKQRAFKHFQFIFDYIDTSAITGKNYLPLLISETLSDFYYTRDPKREQEIIKATKISGIQNESVSQFMGSMYLKINFYDNFINVFEKSFVSPIAGVGRAYYKYYLLDSSYVDNQWCYQISFKPRRKQEPTFTGDFWVHDTTFAIKKFQIRIAKDANINFINDMVISHEFTKIDTVTWILTKENVFADFNLSDKQIGFFGRKTSSYKNIIVNQPIDESKFSQLSNIIVKEDATEKDGTYWKESRHDTLSVKEEAIYTMVDSIKEVPVFKSVIELVTMFLTGYKVFGPVEIGPYYTLYSFNEIEGNRLKLGGRTSNSFSTKYMLDGYFAYGLKDTRPKYALGGIYVFSQLPRHAIRVFYKNDMEQLGQSANAFLSDNILSSLFRRNPNNKISMVEEYKAYWEKEWIVGFSNRLTISHKNVSSTKELDFQVLVQDTTYAPVSSRTRSEILLNTRFAYQEKFLLGKFERISMGTDYPILNLNLTIGLKDVFGSNYEYYKANFSIEQKFNINPLGRFKYLIDVGQIWGRAPYPFLQMHEGNETYGYDPYAFNMMNYYEFVSDRYASIFLEHHFDGFFLNRIPLFRKLKWREVVSGKGVIGDISEKNARLMRLNTNLTLNELTKPYFEAAVGIENIFKLLRIDAVWRLSYLDHADIQTFGMRAIFQFTF